MVASKYREFFRSLSDIITLYVGLLALIGLLASVGFYRLRIEPTLKVLEPTYLFDMSQLIKAYESYSPSVPLPDEWRGVSNQFASFRIPPKVEIPLQSRLEAVLPFRHESVAGETNLPRWAKPSSPTDLFHNLGLTNKPGGYDAQPPNFSAKRSDDLKRYGVGLAITLDIVRLAMERGVGQFDYRLMENPLAKFQQIIPPRDPRQEHPQFVSDGTKLDLIAQATYVYSIVSVANSSSQPLENVRLNVPNSFWSGSVSLVGWSDVPQSVDSIEKNEGYHITVERLEPQQSIEFVFRGHKVLRKTGISVSTSWNFDKVSIGIGMLVTLLLVVTLYYGDFLAAKLRRVLRS